MSENDQPKANLVYLHSLLDTLEADVKARHEAKEAGKALGPTTGLPKIDATLGGSLASGLHILHGQAGTGKSALALQIAASCGCPCLFLTAEMSTLECFRRIVCRTTRTFASHFKSGEMHPSKARELATRTIKTVPYLAFVDASTAPANMPDVMRFAQDVRKHGDGNQHLLIVVDSVHSWVRGWAGNLEEYEALNEGLKLLRQLSQTLDAAVLGIAERNRASKTGGLSASAGSRMFEYSAETVLDLDYKNDERKEADATGDKQLKLTFSKNRHGKTGYAHITFNVDFQSFTEAN